MVNILARDPFFPTPTAAQEARILFTSPIYVVGFASPITVKCLKWGRNYTYLGKKIEKWGKKYDHFVYFPQIKI